VGDEVHAVPLEFPEPPVVEVEGPSPGEKETVDLTEPVLTVPDGIEEAGKGSTAKKVSYDTGPSEDVRRSGESARAVNGEDDTAVKLAKAEKRYEGGLGIHLGNEGSG
jgi:hypothetical protein